MMIRRFATLLVCALLSACAPLQPGSGDGLGGTGVVADSDGVGHRDPGDDDGLGGTGHTGDDDDGIGGTGMWASAQTSGDVAIVGVITALNHLVVNGHGMYVDDRTAIQLNGEAATETDLEVGQVVAVRAGLVGGVITAKAIRIEDSVVGPVTSVAADSTAMQVLGQSIRLGPLSRIELADAAPPKPGDVVRISGLRRLDGSVEATLVRSAEPAARFFVTGSVQAGSDGTWSIGGLDVDPQTLASSADGNAIATVQGEFRDGRFYAQTVTTRPPLPFAQEVAHWSIQGFAAVGADARIRFSGYPTPLKSLPADTTVAPNVTSDRRVIIELRDADDGVRVDRVKPSPVRLPEAGIFIPRYAPGLIQPDVVIAPGLPAQPIVPEPVITIPQRQPVVRTPSVTRIPGSPAIRPTTPPVRLPSAPPVADVPSAPPVVPAPAPVPVRDVIQMPAMDGPRGIVR